MPVEYERRPSGVWTVHIQEGIGEPDYAPYMRFLGRMSGRRAEAFYTLGSESPLSCFEAVSVWCALNNEFPHLNFGRQMCMLEKPLKSSISPQDSHTGQVMLRVTQGKGGPLLLADVASYIFGFPLEDIPLTIANDPQQAAEILSDIYTAKFQAEVTFTRTLSLNGS